MNISEALRVLFDEEHLGDFAAHVRDKIEDPTWKGSPWGHPRVTRAQQAITALQTHRLALAHFLEMCLPPEEGIDGPDEQLPRDPGEQILSICPEGSAETVQIANPHEVTMTATQAGVFQVHVPPAHTLLVNGQPIDHWPPGTLREVLKNEILPNFTDASYLLNLEAGAVVTVKRHDVH